MTTVHFFYRVNYYYPDKHTTAYPWKGGKIHSLSKLIKTGKNDIIRNGDIVNIHWKNRHGYETWGRSHSSPDLSCEKLTWNWGKLEDVNMPGGPFEIVKVYAGGTSESNLFDCDGGNQRSTKPSDCAPPNLPAFQMLR